MKSPAQPEAPPELQPVEVRYEHTWGLPELLEQLELSVLLSTYQAGRVVSVGMRDAIWTLPANLGIAPHLQPEGEHDIAFLARSCHHSGPLMGHDLAWGGERL
jgi:hypothetical protein